MKQNAICLQHVKCVFKNEFRFVSLWYATILRLLLSIGKSKWFDPNKIDRWVEVFERLKPACKLHKSQRKKNSIFHWQPNLYFNFNENNSRQCKLNLDKSAKKKREEKETNRTQTKALNSMRGLFIVYKNCLTQKPRPIELIELICRPHHQRPN